MLTKKLRDWTGSGASTFKTIGARNTQFPVTHHRAAYDFYATDPIAIYKLFQQFGNIINIAPHVWECACGNGHMVEAIHSISPHTSIFASDIIRRDYPCHEIDFLTFFPNETLECDIITNPPYKYATDFILHALNIIHPAYRVIMLLKLTYLETKMRYHRIFSHYAPRYILIFTERIQCYINGIKNKNRSAICYAWFIWQKEWTGKPTIDWII